MEPMLDGSVRHSRQTSHPLHGPHPPAASNMNKHGHVEVGGMITWCAFLGGECETAPEADLHLLFLLLSYDAA